MVAERQAPMDYLFRAEYWDREAAARTQRVAQIIQRTEHIAHVGERLRLLNAAALLEQEVADCLLRANSERRRWVDQTAKDAVDALLVEASQYGTSDPEEARQANQLRGIARRLEDATAYAMTRL